MDDNKQLHLSHLDLCLLFNSWANRCADYVQTDGGGRGIDLNTLDYLLANVERFGLAMAKTIRLVQAKVPIDKKKAS